MADRAVFAVIRLVDGRKDVLLLVVLLETRQTEVVVPRRVRQLHHRYQQEHCRYRTR